MYISHSQSAIAVIDICILCCVSEYFILFHKLFAYSLLDGLCGCKGAGEFIDFWYLVIL